ncbi:hypothetical protein DV711_06215 [Motiliproteus coralliicola]|uniref:Uncharacterized protein n=1 Tax=Motiliproteus coralliicola TaxID=2283196 RepID=A0A369WU07_9GAMM|nr:hypothetical protein [Motiliproteus coralliicola]RDE25147.1 hypothetical protein DV711_06215 [Motiliproteus coralliicola]
MNFQLNNNLETTTPAGPFFVFCMLTHAEDEIRYDLGKYLKANGEYNTTLHTPFVRHKTELVDFRVWGHLEYRKPFAFKTYKEALKACEINQRHNGMGWTYLIIGPDDELHAELMAREFLLHEGEIK